MIGNFVFFDKSDEVGGSVAGQGGFGEVWILREEILRLAMKVGEVAAASAGNKDFFADFFGAFEEQDTAAAFGGFSGAEEAGGAGAEDEDVIGGQEVTDSDNWADLETGIIQPAESSTQAGWECVYSLNQYSTARRVRRAPQGWNDVHRTNGRCPLKPVR